MFKEDFEEKETDLVSTQRRVDPLQEVFLRNRAVGGESSDEEEREAVLDEECKLKFILLFYITYKAYLSNNWISYSSRRSTAPIIPRFLG